MPCASSSTSMAIRLNISIRFLFAVMVLHRSCYSGVELGLCSSCSHDIGSSAGSFPVQWGGPGLDFLTSTIILVGHEEAGRHPSLPRGVGAPTSTSSSIFSYAFVLRAQNPCMS